MYVNISFIYYYWQSVTSKPVNLDGWNFSCRLLRHTGPHTVHTHTHLHSRNELTHTHALTHTHRAQMSVTSKLVNLDGWNFSCGLLRHTGTHTHMHSHTHTHTHTHTQKHTHRQTCMHTGTHKRTHTHTHAHTHNYLPLQGKWQHYYLGKKRSV